MSFGKEGWWVGVVPPWKDGGTLPRSCLQLTHWCHDSTFQIYVRKKYTLLALLSLLSLVNLLSPLSLLSMYIVIFGKWNKENESEGYGSFWTINQSSTINYIKQKLSYVLGGKGSTSCHLTSTRCQDICRLVVNRFEKLIFGRLVVWLVGIADMGITSFLWKGGRIDVLCVLQFTPLCSLFCRNVLHLSLGLRLCHWCGSTMPWKGICCVLKMPKKYEVGRFIEYN